MSIRVSMNQTRRGSQDGVTVETHVAGVEYELCDALAAVYLAHGWCERVVEPDLFNAPVERVPSRAKVAAPPARRKSVKPRAKKKS